MRTATLASNPFALMTDPGAVRQLIDRSAQLTQLSQRQCRPLDKAVIRSASAELAAWDAKIDRTTVYLAPDEERSQPLVRSLPETVN
ncbi:MAG: hypothetical protein ABIT82_13395 [Ramlibacter sp.]